MPSGSNAGRNPIPTARSNSFTDAATSRYGRMKPGATRSRYGPQVSASQSFTTWQYAMSTSGGVPASKPWMREMSTAP